MPVTVAMTTERDVPVEIQVIGNVEAYSTITVKAQVGGQLTDVFFHEGDFVKKGEKLFAIDRRPLEAAYNQALANIARDQASLGQARANLARDEAQAKYQDTQAKRYAALNESGVISKDQAEQLRASADAMRAGGERRQGGHRRAPRRRSAPARRRPRTPKSNWASPTIYLAHQRAHRQPDGEDRATW